MLLSQFEDLIGAQTTTAVPDSIPSVKEELSMLQNIPLDDLIEKFVNSMITFAVNLAIAIFVFYVGKFVITRIFHILTKVFIRRSVDRSLSTFILSLIRMVLYFILIVTVISILGIETSSFIAIFASAGVAVGMALSGTLQNFAGGVLILLIKPYKVGDYIEAQGYAGTVREIQIFHTIICTPDNKSIIIPNGGLSTGSINNWSKEDYRRVDWMVGISYGDDIKVARKKLLEIVAEDSRIVKRYIEEDRKMRHIKEQEDDSKSSNVDDIKEKPSLWRRIFGRHANMKNRLDNWQAQEALRLKQMLPPIERKPEVVVTELADSSVVLRLSAWTRTDYYWPVYLETNERIYNELPTVGVNFPFPQMDVHLNNK
jgi:small conductance mechanosensitive channel